MNVPYSTQSGEVPKYNHAKQEGYKAYPPQPPRTSSYLQDTLKQSICSHVFLPAFLKSHQHWTTAALPALFNATPISANRYPAHISKKIILLSMDFTLYESENVSSCLETCQKMLHEY